MRIALACLVSMLCAAQPEAQGLYELPRDALPAQNVRSIVFDARKAAEERSKSEPLYVESIVVEGRNPDAPRKRSLEVRFAEALAPRPSPLAAVNPLNDVPCMSLPSTWNNIGDTHVPLSGCPR